MASTSAPYGLRPVRLLGGRVYAGSVTHYKIASGYATSIFKGDVVKLVTAGTIEKDTGTNTATPVGVFMGCEYSDPTLNYLVQRQYWPASTVASDAMALVADDPDLIFEVQGDGTLAQTALGANVDLEQGAGNTATGNSGVGIDVSQIESTTTLPLRIIGFVDRPGSAVGDSYTDAYVIWNHGVHQFRNATGLA